MQTPPAGLILDSRKGPWILLSAAAVLLLICPGAASLWTHEGRWAVICREMLRSGDYFHPYLFDEEYFDKPLLSYWLMIGCSRLLGGLGEAALRIPGMLAGVLAVACTWRIGATRFNPKVGLTAGWLLLTCVFFAYWSRVASADIFNLTAVVAAAAWYTERRERPGFTTWSVFLAILAVGAQFKGLIAPVLAVLAILPDLATEGRWKRHLKPSLALAPIPAMALYLVPFLLAGATAGEGYASSGLLLVFKENVLRYFKPFDHIAPFYVYIEFLPIYALPWSLLLPGVLWRARRWKDLSAASRWPLLASLAILVFLTLGSGRRNYYLLPILPFVMLAVADWLWEEGASERRRQAAFGIGAFCAAGMLLYFGLAVPILNSRGDTRQLGIEVRGAAEKQAPWNEWRVVLFDTRPQMGFYLDPVDRPRRLLTLTELEQALQEHPRTVVVTYARKQAQLDPVLAGWSLHRELSDLPWEAGKPKNSPQAQIAYLPPQEVKPPR